MPMQFLLQLRQQYPQFAQQNNTGMYMQQDAEECWTNLLYSLKEALQVICMSALQCADMVHIGCSGFLQQLLKRSVV